MTVLAWLPTELRAWGLDVVEVTGWRDRKRPGTFTPAGCLIHHTAGPRGKDAPSLQVCIDGRRDVPGPLCQLLIARSGKVYVISAGRCNHAGAGGPLDGITDGNGQLLGIELENDGVGEPWPPAQLTAAHRATAAVLKGLGGSGPVWGHKEWAPVRKSDPTFSMAEYRTAVRGLLYPKEIPMPTPASDEMVRQWQQMLLDNGAELGGGADGLFGRLTLAASKTILDHRNQLLAQVDKLQADLDASHTAGGSYVAELARVREANRTSADTIVRLTKERDDARALAEANGNASRLRALLADLDAALTKARA